MATRNLTMVVPRDVASKYVDGFAIHPAEIADNSYVNMYLHHDGYPEWQGVMIAKWVQYMQKVNGFTNFGDPSRISAHMVKDFHYNSQYLYPSVENIDHQYTYIVWTGKSDVWVSCYDNYSSKNVFVLPVDKIIDKYCDKKLDYSSGVEWLKQLDEITN